MKLNWGLMQLLCLLIGFGIIAPVSYVWSEDLLDVELGMEDAFQDSEAAQLEARDARARQLKREQEQEEAEEKALIAIEKAKAKEQEARRVIAEADGEIQRLNKKIEAAEAQTRKAEDQYNVAAEKIAKKKQELEQHHMKFEAKQKFLQEQKFKTQAAADQARDLEEQILELKDKLAKANIDFQKAKKEDALVQKRLKKAKSKLQLQKTLTEEKASLLDGETQKLRQRTQQAYSTLSSSSRAPSSAAPRVLRLALKNNCSAYSSPDSGASAVWSGRKGQTVTASSYDRTWAEVKLEEGKTAYISKSCF